MSGFPLGSILCTPTVSETVCRGKLLTAGTVKFDQLVDAGVSRPNHQDAFFSACRI
jgi:hypothetical protein